MEFLVLIMFLLYWFYEIINYLVGYKLVQNFKFTRYLKPNQFNEYDISSSKQKPHLMKAKSLKSHQKSH